jgi:hypothetical protein
VGLDSLAALNTLPGLVPAWPGDSGMPRPMPTSMPCAIAEPGNAAITQANKQDLFYMGHDPPVESSILAVDLGRRALR